MSDDEKPEMFRGNENAQDYEPLDSDDENTMIHNDL